MNIEIKELRELLTLLDEDGVDGFRYVVFRGKDSASIREYGNIYPQIDDCGDTGCLDSGDDK